MNGGHGRGELTTAVWRVDADEFPEDAPIDERARFLLRYAILAPSSHNSQPWQFAVRGEAVEVSMAADRLLDVADPDRREAHLSLGCAVENLCVAAAHFGLGYRVAYHDEEADADVTDDEADAVATVTLLSDDAPPTIRPSGLFEAITDRYTSHRPFDERPLPRATLDRLRRCVVGDDATLSLVDDDRKRAVGELQAEADEAQMDDPAYRRELGHWVGTGALGSSWLAARVGQVVLTHFDLGEREGRKNSKPVEETPVLGLLATRTDDAPARVRTGRAFERVALAASADGVAVHPLSQTLERPGSRRELASVVGTDEAVPQHLFRLGFVDEAPTHTPRLPVDSVLVEG